MRLLNLFQKISWVSFITDTLFNVALSLTSASLPEQWRLNPWLAWSITGVIGIVSLILTALERLLGKHQPDSESQRESQRKMLLKQLRPRFKKMLNNRLSGQSKRIALDLTRRPEMVAPGPGLPLEFPNRDPQVVSSDRSILEVFGLMFGLAFWLAFGPALGLVFALLSGITFGTFGGEIFGWFGLLQSLDEPSTIQNVEVIRWSWKLGIWQVVGLMLFLVIGMILGILMRLIWGLEPGLGLVAGLVMGVFALLGSFLKSDKVDDRLRQRPNEGILRSLDHARDIGVPFAIGSALLAALSIPLATYLPASFTSPAMQVIAFSTLVAGSLLTWTNGGEARLLHLFLRLALWRAGVAPWNYAALLNAACRHLLMRQRGGGFEFWHLTLPDFLAGRSEAELQELLYDSR